MKNIKYYLFFAATALFTACADDLLHVEETASPQLEHVLNLRSMDYEDLAGVLSKISNTEHTIMLQEGSELWTTSIKAIHGVEIEESNRPVYLFEGQDKDSINAILSQSYATIRLQRGGDLIDYIVYKDKERMAEIANYYQNHYLSASSDTSDKIVVCNTGKDTRSGKSDIKNIRIDITKAIGNNPFKGLPIKDYPTEKLSTIDKNSILSLSSRATYPATLEFMLIKEKDGGSLEHDITSQIQAVTTSLKFLIDSGFITVKYTIKDSSHKGGASDYEVSALESFQNYLRSWDEVKGQDKKPYILLRDGTWDSGKTFGYASGIGVIHLNNPRGNFEVAAISTTSSSHPYTLAHEIGHLLGAEHVDNEQDLMYTWYSPQVTPNHLSADNWVRMLECIQK